MENFFNDEISRASLDLSTTRGVHGQCFDADVLSSHLHGTLMAKFRHVGAELIYPGALCLQLLNELLLGLPLVLHGIYCRADTEGISRDMVRTFQAPSKHLHREGQPDSGMGPSDLPLPAAAGPDAVTCGTHACPQEHTQQRLRGPFL